MHRGSARQLNSQFQAPHPPNVFFDGTRLGLESSMITTLATAVPGGLHTALSIVLGHAVRLSDGLPAEMNEFSLFGFLFASILSIVAISMLEFFAGTIPIMGYSMGLVAYMLHWMRKRRAKEKLTATIIGGVLGLLSGLLGAALGLMIFSLPPNWASYRTIFSWPSFLTIDSIVLLWFSVLPIANAFAGAQMGWKLGKQIEEVTIYWMF